MVGFHYIGHLPLSPQPNFSTILSGLDNFVKDIEFMLNMKLWNYWKLTWAYVIPATLLIIFVYTSATYVVDDIGPGPYPPAIIGMFTAFWNSPWNLVKHGPWNGI